MSDRAIQAAGLGKLYRIGLPRHSRAFRDVLARACAAPFRKRKEQVVGGTLWALRNIDFSIKEGESVAIIGRNGSGKSTLLKILSRIAEPTEGHALIRGRVGSLLEVGTGFHSELTGRENIHLNAAILGMTRREIGRKFDEIVAFSEVERFLETPVKYYSSGMYVRLAFAVAAHMEPEILLVDEVLAVGDAEFQAKCLGKMGEVRRGGRTVLFVSHNSHAVAQLCDRAIWLDGGNVVGDGPAREVLDQYLSKGVAKSAHASWSFDKAPGSPVVRLRSIDTQNGAGEPNFYLDMDEPIRLKAEFWLLDRASVQVSFHINNQDGTLLFATGNFHDTAWKAQPQRAGLYECSCLIPAHLLNEGLHHVTIRIEHGTRTALNIPAATSFHVVDHGEDRAGWHREWKGAIRPMLPWAGRRIGGLPGEKEEDPSATSGTLAHEVSQ
jgi:lipopolysaccharide transport system ATP-binding protein